MLFNTLKALISKGKTEGILEKIDIFYAVGKLTQEEYEGLISMLGAE